jgi:hypothetical protein
MKTILNSLDLIPHGEGGLHLFSVEKKEFKEQTPKKEIQVQVFQPEANAEKRVINLPRFCKISPTKSVRNLNLPPDYEMTHIGRYGEIWSTARGHSAIVRRKDSKVTFYGDDSYQKIYNYWTEAIKRGLSSVQATDIICNELKQ